MITTSSKITPSKLRIALILGIVIIIIGSGVGFWFFKNYLQQYATTVSEETQKATASNNDISRLENVKQILEENKSAIERTKNIVTDSKSYAYQNKIITDIDAYARKAGIEILGYGFAADTEAGAAAPAPTTDAAPVPAGLKTTQITVSINNPVRYDAIMNFIHYLESSLTKMQIAGVSLKPAPEKGNNYVSIDTLNIEVYLR